MSCFMRASSRSSASFHSRERDSVGGADDSGGCILIDPHLPSLRSGFGVKVTVGVVGMVVVDSEGANGAATVVALSDRVRMEAAR